MPTTTKRPALPIGRPALLALAVLGATAVLPPAPLAAQNPLARRSAATQPFAGSFRGEGLALELRWDAAQRGYRGTLSFEGQRYPCRVDERDGGAQGSFTVDGEAYEFRLALRGETLTLVSDGVEHRLVREAQGSGAASAPGGVGIALRHTNDQRFVIEQVTANGPAARAGLKPGGVLVAVDGQSVDGLALREVIARIGGPIGKLVTLTVEVEDELLDVVLERASLERAAAGPAADPRRAADAGSMPPAIAPGVRVTWYLGSATLNGVRSQLVQDDQGNWVDPQSGQRYSDRENPNAAGAGFLQLTILAADAQGIAGDTRNFVMLDPARGSVTSTVTQGLVGDAETLGEYWIHPRKLAATQEEKTPGHRVARLKYPLEGQVFDAIVFETRNASGYFRNTYDLATGLLLVGSSSTTGASVPTVDPNGRVSPGSGATTITSMMLRNVRDLQLPWAGAAAPALRRGEQRGYTGSYSTQIQGVPEMPMQYSFAVQIESAQRGFVVAKTRSRLESGYSAPQESETTRVFGVPMLAGLFVPPAVLRSLRPEQVLDEDPITRFRTVFAGVQDGHAVIVEQGPNETNRFAYELASGMLGAMDFRQTNGVGTTVVRLAVTGR